MIGNQRHSYELAAPVARTGQDADQLDQHASLTHVPVLPREGKFPLLPGSLIRVRSSCLPHVGIPATDCVFVYLPMIYVFVHRVELVYGLSH